MARIKLELGIKSVMPVPPPRVVLSPSVDTPEAGHRTEPAAAPLDEIEDVLTDAHEPMAAVETQNAPAGSVAPAGGTGARKRIARFLEPLRLWLLAPAQHRMLSQHDQLMNHQRVLNDKLEGALSRIDAFAARLEAFDALMSERLWRVEDSLGRIPAMFGPRLDELEVKLRPLIPFDDTSWAIRVRDGYLMAPRDKPLFVAMLVDATSSGLEPGTRRVLQTLAQPGGGAVDVGANIGLLTLALARAVGPTGRVYSFEPEDAARAQLTKTLALQGMRWVTLSDKGVGSREETRTFFTSGIPGHSSLYELPPEENATASTIHIVRLDDVIPQGQRLDVVKIDVEGAELEVLAGMDRVLSENPDLAIIAEYGPSHLARVGLTPKAWFGAFEARGFVAYAIEEPSGYASLTSRQALTDVVSLNLAFVRPGGEAQKRLDAL